MQAGRELDTVIAEKIMNWQWWHKDDYSILIEGDYKWPEDPHFAMSKGKAVNGRAESGGVPHYSTDIAAAWLVVERLAGLGYPTITVSFSAGHQGYIVTVWRNETDPEYQAGRYLANAWDTGLSAPLAICLAALAAVE